ncbi:MAG TPA: DUF2007 domain-containing protein [Caulobacteraceae bacterium]|nr:DUF2007 domain-containing protein [Caulobacteraceae bacterium]
MGLALVTRIPSLMEAQIAAGALRAAGVRAEVFDATFGGMEAPVIEGLGGYRIMAPEEQLTEARQLLLAIKASPGLPTPEEARPWSASYAETARTRRRGMRWLALTLLAIPAIYWLFRIVSG